MSGLKSNYTISRTELLALREILSECEGSLEATSADIESAIEIIDNILYGEYDE